MALTLNTSHALYPYLISLIGVDDDGITKDLVTGQACTENASVTHGTGTYGRHAQTALSGNNSLGITIPTPYPTLPLSNPVGFTFVVFNSGVSRANRGQILNPYSSGCITPCIYTGGAVGWIAGGGDPTDVGTTNVMGNGAHSIGFADTKVSGSGQRSVWVDGSLQSTTATGVGNANDTYKASNIGGDISGGYGAVSLQFVWVAHFRTFPTDAQVASLHSSLGANNVFGLIASGTTDATASGALSALTIVSPTGSASNGADATGSGAFPGISISAPLATATATTGGTITTPPLKNNTGTLLASISGWSVVVTNPTTGALVTVVTGLSTDSSGVLTFQSGSLVTGTNYAYEPVHATYGRRLPIISAS